LCPLNIIRAWPNHMLASEDWMDLFIESALAFLHVNTIPALLSLVAANLIMLIWLLYLSCQGVRWRRRYHALMGQSTAQGLEEKLMENKQLLEVAIAGLKELERKCANIEQQTPGYLQRVGMVRYNAFPEVGSDLSYSVALLDGNGDGVVVSGIYGRDETRTFAKPIKRGQSTYRLTQEEEKAITLAHSNKTP